MRLLLLPAVAVLLAGCGLFGEGRVREAVVQSVTLEALPLEQPWDRPGPDTDPDVYVDFKSPTAGILAGPYVRTTIAEDVRAASLPVRLSAAGGRPIPVRDPLFINVADRDGGLDSDDLMFASDTLRLETLVRPEDRPGTARTLTFEGGGTRLLVRVEWQ